MSICIVLFYFVIKTNKIAFAYFNQSLLSLLYALLGAYHYFYVSLNVNFAFIFTLILPQINFFSLTSNIVILMAAGETFIFQRSSK